MIILNVGLKIDALGDEFNTDSVCRTRALLIKHTLQAQGYDVASTVKQSETEQTAVIIVQNEDAILIEYGIRHIANALGQDCIAVYFPNDDYGALIGINADKWGEFNKDYFLMP